MAPPDSCRRHPIFDQQQHDVMAATGVFLLLDDVINAFHTGGVTDYGKRLTEKAVQRAVSDFKNVQCQADLVDANNGNVWLTPSKEVTVYWPYPYGTDADTEFRFVLFEGLNHELNIPPLRSNPSRRRAHRR